MYKMQADYTYKCDVVDMPYMRSRCTQRRRIFEYTTHVVRTFYLQMSVFIILDINILLTFCSGFVCASSIICLYAHLTKVLLFV